MDVTVKIWSTEARAMAMNIIISYRAVWRESYYYTTRVFAFGGDMSTVLGINTITWRHMAWMKKHARACSVINAAGLCPENLLLASTWS